MLRRVAPMLVMPLAALAAGLLQTSRVKAEPSGASAALDADAHAERSPGATVAEHPFRLSLGTGLTLGLSEVEERGGDSVDIGGSFFLLNLSVAASYQLDESWALGLRGSFSSDSGARGQSSSFPGTNGAPAGSGEDVSKTRNLWQLAAEGRYQPGVRRGPYVAANAGAAAATDAFGAASTSQWAPMLGGALGYDFEVTEAFALGLELRGGCAFFDEEGATLTRAGESETYVYGSSAWMSLNLTGHLAL